MAMTLSCASCCRIVRLLIGRLARAAGSFRSLIRRQLKTGAKSPYDFGFSSSAFPKSYIERVTPDVIADTLCRFGIAGIARRLACAWRTGRATLALAVPHR
jgi:hypothetical protein